MKIKSLILVISIFIVIFIGLFFFFQQSRVESLSKEEVNPIDLCNSIERFTGRLAGGKVSCLTALAKFNKDLSFCDQIPKTYQAPSGNLQEGLRSDCYHTVAVESNDLEICEMSEVEDLDMCKNAVLRKLAISQIDISYCNQIVSSSSLDVSSKRDSCYLEINKISPSNEICEKIKLDLNKAWCLGDVAANKADVSICEDLPDSTNNNKMRCFIKVAKSLNDEAICNLLEGNEFDNCIYELASTTLDTNLCTQLSHENLINSCLNNIAIQNKDISSCHDFENHFCVSEIASSLMDASLCDEIDEKLDRNSCYIKVAQVSGDSSICNKLKNKNLWEKDICLNGVARTILNPEICKPIENDWYKDWCYTNLVNNYYDYEKEDSIFDEAF